MDRTLRESKANFLRLSRAVCNMVQPAPKSQPKIAFSPRMNLLPGGHARFAAKTRHLHQAREQAGIFEVVRAPRVIHNSKLSAMMGRLLLERLWATGQGGTPPLPEARSPRGWHEPKPYLDCVAPSSEGRTGYGVRSERPRSLPVDPALESTQQEGTPSARVSRTRNTRLGHKAGAPPRQRGTHETPCLASCPSEQPSVSGRSRIGAGSSYLSDLRA
jgi:hypothetical protein